MPSAGAICGDGFHAHARGPDGSGRAAGPRSRLRPPRPSPAARTRAAAGGCRRPRGATTGVRRSMSRSDGTSTRSRPGVRDEHSVEVATHGRRRHGAAPDEDADPLAQQRVGEQPNAVQLEEHRRVPRERHRECGGPRPRAHELTLPETATVVGTSSKGQPSASAVSTLSTKASTSTGSNCKPASRRSSAKAWPCVIAARYGRSAIIAW